MAARETEIVEVAVVGRVPKNAMTEVVGRVVEIRGRQCVDLRVFAQTANGPKPTRAGICINLEGFGGVAELVRKLARAAAAAAPVEEGTSPGPASGDDDSGGGPGEGEEAGG